MRFVQAVNSLGPQVWAFLILIVGCAAVLSFHKAGIDIGIAAGIIGAAVNMFTGIARAVEHPSTPAEPAQPKQ